MTSSPQLEDGHTRIANELLEALLLAKLTSRQWTIVMALVRKTYGYNKKTDDIGLGQLSDLTGLAKSHVSVAVRELEDRRIISRKQGKFGHIMGVNKNHVQWTGVERRIAQGVTELVTGVTESVTVTDSVIGGYQIGKSGVTESVTTKDNPTKDNTQKKAPREEITFKKWIDKCKAEGVKPIPEDDPVFDYADEVKIPMAFVRYAWLEFRRKFGDSSKRYKLWNRTFQNAVRENWYGIWYERDGVFLLTTRGKQMELEMNAKNELTASAEKASA